LIGARRAIVKDSNLVPLRLVIDGGRPQQTPSPSAAGRSQARTMPFDFRAVKRRREPGYFKGKRKCGLPPPCCDSIPRTEGLGRTTNMASVRRGPAANAFWRNRSYALKYGLGQ